VCDGCFTGPDCKIPIDCGEHGTCNPTSGMCECEGCYTPESECTELNDCNGNGVCDSGNGLCECDACYDPTDHCATLISCPANQVCNPMNGVCECGPCHTGDNCVEHATLILAFATAMLTMTPRQNAVPA